MSPTTPRTRPRYFTPAEANAVLPEVAARMTEVHDLARRHRELRERLREGIADEEERTTTARDASEVRDRARMLLEEVGELGVEVKGIDPARVDFPAMRYGQEVFLCWRHGEAAVGWWHAVHAGAAGRQALDDPESGAWEWCH